MKFSLQNISYIIKSLRIY